MKKTIDDLATPPKAGLETEGSLVMSPSQRFFSSASATSEKVSPSVAALMMLQGGTDTPESRAHAASLIGGLLAGMKGMFSDSYTDSKNAVGARKTQTETKEGTTTTMGAELVLRDDGSTVFGLELKTDSVKDGVRVSAEMNGTVDGLECPNAEGQVPITVKLRLGGESAGIGYTQDLTVFIRTTVDDNAEIATTTFDVVQGTRQVSNGRDIYVESGESLQYNGNDVAGGKMSNTRLIQNTGNVTREDVSDLSGQGHNAAYRMAQTILTMTKSKWQNGGCVMIKADSPGKVEVGSTTQVPVNVIHKFGGAEVPSKLEVTLEGGESVNPTLIPRTAGTLTYLAPSETGKTATIKLKASSRRGRATLELKANTGGGSYQVVGGLDDWQTNSKVCDIMKPFTMTGGGFTMKLSGGLSGTYDYSGPSNAHGTGTYTITLPDGVGKPGTMTGSGEGSAEGHSNSGTEKYTLTPIEPCS